MGENEALQLQQEIGQNMSVPTQHPFAMTPEEMAFNNQPANSRFLRRNGRSSSADNNITNITRSIPQNFVVIQELACSNKHTANWIENIDHNIVTSIQQNNKTKSEDMETIRENIKNNRNSLKRRSSEQCLTIEQASRGRSRSIGTIDPEHLKALSINKGQSQSPSLPVKFYISDSKESLNSSTDDLRNPCSPSKESTGVELINQCRKFYFSHQKSLEGVKQSVRSSKHKRARDKMEGKPCNGLDLAMDRLSSEMVRKFSVWRV